MYKKNDKYIPVKKDYISFICCCHKCNWYSFKQGGKQNLFGIFATAFAGGLLALITPCVYSMIPVTVCFFTKRSKTKAEGIRNAISYSTSIIIIFTLLGF